MDNKKNIKISFFLIFIGFSIFFLYYLFLRDIFSLSSPNEVGDSQLFSGFYGDSFSSLVINFFREFNSYFLGLFSLKKFIYVMFFATYFLIFLKFKISLLIIFLPFLFINLISTNTTFVSLINHHIVTLVPVLLFNLYYNKNYFKDTFYNFKIIYLYILLFILITPNFISPFFYYNKYDLFNYSNYTDINRKFYINEKIKNLFDKNDIISIQNNINNYNFSFRENYLLFPEGVFKPKFKKNYGIDKPLFSDYIIIDANQTTYIYDKRCPSINSLCAEVNNVRTSFKDLLNNIINSNQFDIIFNFENFYIFKRIIKND